MRNAASMKAAAPVRRGSEPLRHLERSLKKQWKRYRKAIKDCRKELAGQRKGGRSTAAAARLLAALDRAFARAKRLRARICGDDAKTIHRTRVAFKKFRYMVEALAHHLPGVDDQRLLAMRQYQAMMGDIQDVEVLRAALDKFLRKHDIGTESAGRLREELLRRRQWLVRAYLGAADKLREFWP